MSKRYLALTLLIAITLPMAAQIFNFSLRTNNQQLIDKALSGALVRINQSYELSDTVHDEHFGREGRDYFSIIPFVGVNTEKGLIFPAAVLTPWAYDKDYDKYKDKYKPVVTKSSVCILNANNNNQSPETKSTIFGESLSKHLCMINDSTITYYGLEVDSIPGMKEGWLIWVATNMNLADTDSVKFTSIKKNIDVPVDGERLSIDVTDIAETVYGGIYVTPIVSEIGKLTFTLTGVMVLDEEGWFLDFPFIKQPEETTALTPINKLPDRGKLNQLKKK